MTPGIEKARRVPQQQYLPLADSAKLLQFFGKSRTLSLPFFEKAFIPVLRGRANCVLFKMVHTDTFSFHLSAAYSKTWKPEATPDEIELISARPDSPSIVFDSVGKILEAWIDLGGSTDGPNQLPGFVKEIAAVLVADTSLEIVGSLPTLARDFGVATALPEFELLGYSEAARWINVSPAMGNYEFLPT